MLEVSLPFLAFFAATAVMWAALFFAGPPLARASVAISRWLWNAPDRHGRFLRTKQRLEPWAAYAAPAAIALAGIVVTVLLGEQFFELAAYLRTQDGRLLDADQAIYAYAADTRTAALTVFFAFFTHLGSPGGLALITVITAIALWRQLHRPLAIYLLTTVTAGGLINVLLKLYFQRARPDLTAAVLFAHGTSFPSGHAMGGIVTMTALGYVIHRLRPKWALRSAGYVFLIAVALSIGLSRLYLGVHWLSDIAAGFSVGLLWFAAATGSYEVWRRLRRLRSSSTRL